MNNLNFKNQKNRYITSLGIILFYTFYFFVGSIATEWSNVQNIWISNIIFLLINVIILILINFEMLKLLKFKGKKIIFLQIISYLGIILLYLMPYSMEINDYAPYRNINDGLSWIRVHNWFTPIYYLLIYLFYLLIPAFQHRFSFKNISFLFLFTLFIVSSLKSMTIIMLHSDYGWTSLLYLFIIVMVTDSASYIGGSLYGKRKLAPNISPNKTWAGFLIGILFGLIFSLGFVIAIYFSFNSNIKQNEYVPFLNLIQANNKAIVFIIYFLFSIVLSFVSQLGDLLFSSIKRKNNIKDFSNLLPGHGGILDRMDSIIVISLFAFLFTQTIEFV